MSTQQRQVHLAAHFPGVNNTTVWSDPLHRSQIDFTAFEHFARNAERGRFDYIFLAEGLRLREHKGRIHDLDVVGRPSTLAVLTALAAVTRHIGFVGTLTATFNEPYEIARQLATFDHLSRGRAGWNVVTSPDDFHGANFRRGGFLDHERRYERADEFLTLAKQLWDSWDADAIAADKQTGSFLASGRRHGAFEHHGAEFDAQGVFNVPRSPQGRPVLVQAGDSEGGRELAAKHAEVIFSRHSEFEDGQEFYRDVKGRLAKYGRSEDGLKILPAVTFVIGDTEAEAKEKAVEVTRGQFSPQTAVSIVEKVWGRDLSDLDPDGPLPEIDPDPDRTLAKGWAGRDVPDPFAVAKEWRRIAEAERLSLRELVIRVSGRQSFVGTPVTIAAEINRYVQERASDGFVVVGTTSPYGLDEFTDRVIPELQELGVYRRDYEQGATLRQTLGLPGLGSAQADSTKEHDRVDA